MRCGSSYKLRIRVKEEGAIVAEAEKQFYFASDMKITEETPVAPPVDENALFAASDFWNHRSGSGRKDRPSALCCR